MSLIPIPAQTFNSLPMLSIDKPALSSQDLLDINEAIAHLSKKVRENSGLVDEYIELGRLFRKKGEYQRSFLLHRNLLARDELKREQQARIYAELGYDYLFSRTKDFGEQYFIQSLKLNKDSAYVLEGLYQCYRLHKELEKAADTLRLICKIYPDRKKDLAGLLTEVALHKAELHHMSSAKKCVEQAFEYDEHSPLVYLTKAHLQTLEGKRKDAIETLEEYIEKWPNHTLFALKKIENLHYEMSQYARYPYSLNKCIQKNPQNFYAHHAYGKYLIKIRRFDEAIEQFKKALDLCPYSIQSLKEVIRLYTNNQNVNEALLVIENFITSLPNQHANNCPRCHEGFSDLSRNCPICMESNKFDERYTTAGA